MSDSKCTECGHSAAVSECLDMLKQVINVIDTVDDAEGSPGTPEPGKSQAAVARIRELLSAYAAKYGLACGDEPEKPDKKIPELVDVLDPNGRVLCSKCHLAVQRYMTNNNIAISAVCTGASVSASGERMAPGDLWAFLTVNPGSPLPDSMVAVKDYAESEGSLRTLAEAGIIDPQPVRLMPAGFAHIKVCMLTEQGREWAEAEVMKSMKGAGDEAQ